MATAAFDRTDDRADQLVRERGFFLTMAIVMAMTVVAGFSLQLAMGRSSFGAPPLVHAHAIVFMGWMVIYVTQTAIAAHGPMTLHRRLGWIAAGWAVAMVGLGFAITLAKVQRGAVPFFFRPTHFLIMDPMSVLAFAGLTAAAIRLRRQTQWHSRLHFCGMAILLGPAFGRLLPMPLMIPWSYYAVFAATLIYPLIGVAFDLRRSGRVHPAWGWGIGAMFAMLIVTDAVTYSPIGTALYRATTAGSPGAAIDPLAYPPSPAS